MSNDPQLDELLAYAKQMGLMPQQPTAVDPNVDHFAQSLDPLQQYLASQEQPTDASAAEKGAHLTFANSIPSGIPDVGDITIDRGAPPPAGAVRQPTSQVINGAMNGKSPDQMTDAEYADWLEAQGAKPLRNDAGNWTAGGNSPDLVLSTPTPNFGAAPQSKIAPADAGAVPDDAPQEDDGSAPILMGGGGYIPPRQVDLLNPTGKDDTNRVEYDAGWNDQFQALGQRNMDLERQTSDRMEAIDAQKARAQAAYDEQRNVLTGQLKAQQDHAAAMANAKQWADSAADAAQKEAADATVDQGHFFASRGAGQQIALVIGAALGALGSSLTNTPNYALQMIQGAMADDMQAQQANLANKRASASSALKRAMDATGDLDAAKNLVRLQQLQVAQNTIDQYSKMDLADDQKAKLMEIHDGLKAQILDTRGRMMQDRAVKDMQLRPMVGGGFVGGGSGTAGDAQTAKNSVSVPREDGKGWDDYAVTNPEDRPELVEKSIAVRGAQQIANQIHAIVKKGGANWRSDPTLSAEMDSLRGQLSRVVKSKTGDSSDKDREALEGMIGDPKAWLANGDKVLAQFIANQGAQLRTRIKVINAEPIQRTRYVDATGRQHAGAILAPPIRGAGTMPPIKPLTAK